MKNMDGFIIGAFGLWQMGAGIALIVGLVVGAQDALQRIPMKRIRLFDTQAKVIWFVYAAAHALAYALFGGFSSSPQGSSAMASPPGDPDVRPSASKKQKQKGKRSATAGET